MQEPAKTAAEERPQPPPRGYYLRWQGRVSGPFDPDTIERGWQTGSISRLHQVSSDRKVWQALGTHPDLKPRLDRAAEPAAAGSQQPVECGGRDSPQGVADAALAETSGPGKALQPERRRGRSGQTGRRTPSGEVAEELGDLAPQPAVPYPGAVPTPSPAEWPSGLPEAAWGLDPTGVGPAPWGRRLGAALLDLLVLGLVGLCGWLLLQALGLPGGGRASAQKLICGLILAYSGWLYSAILESCAWQATLGKLALGLRVETEDGAPLDFGSAALRAFMKFWSVLPALAGVLPALRSPTRQTWHDRVAKTRVVGPLPTPADYASSNHSLP
jgi:uncharacterized RDD family membrane protein YckC